MILPPTAKGKLGLAFPNPRLARGGGGLDKFIFSPNQTGVLPASLVEPGCTGQGIDRVPLTRKGQRTYCPFLPDLRLLFPTEDSGQLSAFYLTKRHKRVPSTTKLDMGILYVPTTRLSLYLPKGTRCTTWRCSFCPLSRYTGSHSNTR